MSNDVITIPEENQDRIKVDMIHEKMFKELDIDPIEIFKTSGLLKTIPKSWINESIIETINNIKIPRQYENISEGEITFSFNAIEDCLAFYDQFNSNLYNTLNTYIENKDDNPKQYNRIITIESVQDGLQLSFRY